MDVNPFKSLFFYWVDFGCGRDNKTFPDTKCWAPNNIMTDPRTRDKVVLMAPYPFRRPSIFSIKSIDSIGIEHMKTIYIKGVFFGGVAHAMIKYADLFHSVFTRLLRRNFTDDEQTIMAACYVVQKHTNQNLIHLHLSPISDFFNMFRVFH